MLLNLPNLVTYLRMILIPMLVVSYYLPYRHAHVLATALFVLAGITDWLDGYLARKLNQSSPFGAFLDPVADKLMVVTALVLLVADDTVRAEVYDPRLFAVVVLIIIGRELAVSALREWMAGVGKSASVAVSIMGKLKTTAQMVAITFLLLGQPVRGLNVFALGEVLLYGAAGLTLWSMFIYLRAAWPELVRSGSKS